MTLGTGPNGFCVGMKPFFWKIGLSARGWSLTGLSCGIRFTTVSEATVLRVRVVLFQSSPVL